MKVFLMVIFLFFSSTALAFDPMVDLQGSIAVQQGRCSHKEKFYMCIGVTKGDMKYLVLGNSKDIVAVYAVTEFKTIYKKEDLVNVWEIKEYTRNDI